MSPSEKGEVIRIAAGLLKNGQQSDIIEDWPWCKTTPMKDKMMFMSVVAQMNEYMRAQAIALRRLTKNE